VIFNYFLKFSCRRFGNDFRPADFNTNDCPVDQIFSDQIIDDRLDFRKLGHITNLLVLAPAADFQVFGLNPGDSFDKAAGNLTVGYQHDVEIGGRPADHIAVGQFALLVTFRNIDDQVNLVILDI
jgi:hypothetical protein